MGVGWGLGVGKAGQGWIRGLMELPCNPWAPTHWLLRDSKTPAAARSCGMGRGLPWTTRLTTTPTPTITISTTAWAATFATTWLPPSTPPATAPWTSSARWRGQVRVHGHGGEGAEGSGRGGGEAGVNPAEGGVGGGREQCQGTVPIKHSKALHICTPQPLAQAPTFTPASLPLPNTLAGLAPIAGALAVEMVAALLQHPLGPGAPASTCVASSGKPGAGAAAAGAGGVVPEPALGHVPHMVRGQLSGFSQSVMEGRAFSQCTACSAAVVGRYLEGGWDFVLQAIKVGRLWGTRSLPVPVTVRA